MALRTWKAQQVQNTPKTPDVIKVTKSLKFT